jgi:hypothetical protein
MSDEKPKRFAYQTAIMNRVIARYGNGQPAGTGLIFYCADGNIKGPVMVDLQGEVLTAGWYNLLVDYTESTLVVYAKGRH